MEAAEFKARLRRALDANKQTLDAIERRVVGRCVSVRGFSDGCFEVVLAAAFRKAADGEPGEPGEPHDPIVLRVFPDEAQATTFADATRRTLTNIISLGRGSLLQIFRPATVEPQ